MRQSFDLQRTDFELVLMGEAVIPFWATGFGVDEHWVSCAGAVLFQRTHGTYPKEVRTTHALLAVDNICAICGIVPALAGATRVSACPGQAPEGSYSSSEAQLVQTRLPKVPI